MTSKSVIQKKYQKINHCLDEKSRRLWCASEALAIKEGGVAMVHAATGVSRPTIYAGIEELEGYKRGRKRKKRRRRKSNGRIRKVGGGAKTTSVKTPEILQALEALIEPETRGDPQSPLRWTNKGLRKLASELNKQGFDVCHSTVADLLKKLGYSLQLNGKDKEGKTVTNRNEKLEYIKQTKLQYPNNTVLQANLD